MIATSRKLGVVDKILLKLTFLNADALAQIRLSSSSRHLRFNLKARPDGIHSRAERYRPSTNLQTVKKSFDAHLAQIFHLEVQSQKAISSFRALERNISRSKIISK